MGIRKQYDWVGENLANPDFTNTDFKNVGITVENTSIAPESVYLNNSSIRQLPEFQTNGQFDAAKFHEKYVELASSYNDLARNTYFEDLKKLGRIFSENNIFVSPEERRLTSESYMTIMNNPDHISYGIVGINLPGPRTKSVMELAEQNRIYDPATGKFTDYTVEESFFKDFWRPKILATYDENVDINGNPTNDPEKIAHVKGEYKLDENGEYYAEFANGKSTYGKEIVSLWNIITKEDSWINKYDPFDSDGITKSVPGAIVRNALKVLPLFTPVAPQYAAASLGINLVDALGTLGKLIVGSNNHTLNTITAFAEQFNQTTSEEGVAHPFSMENILNMVGDTFMFLESQRIFAELAPKLFNSEAARIAKDPNLEIRKLTGSYIAEGQAAINKKYKELTKITSDLSLLNYNKAQEVKALHSIAGTRAAAIVNNQVNNYHKLGRLLSTSFMAITFGLHTYGVAKAQNVTDEAATALTLGAIAGQFALLNSHIAQKIFPEATLERQLLNKAIKEWIAMDETYIKQVEATAEAVTSLEKQKAIMPIFSKGYNLAKSIWDVLESIPATIAASTVATGIEMMSFSVLDDLIASTYNLASWISGNDNRMNAWDNVLERYGTSLLGGGIAGGMSARRIYLNVNKIKKMEKPEAFATIIHMINEGKEGELLKIIDKGLWGSDNLSTEIIARKQLNDGTYEDLYGTGTPEKNENLEIKKILKDAIIDLKTVLETYGTIISKDSLLDVMVNGKNITKDLRLAALKQSNFARSFIKLYVDNLYEIYLLAQQISLDPEAKAARGETDAMSREIKEQIKQIEKAETPAEYLNQKDKSSEQTNDVINARDLLAEKIKENRKFFNGEKRLELVKKSLFEMQYGLNSPFIDRYFVEWATNEAKVDSFDKIPRSTLLDLAKQFYELAGSELELLKLNRAFDLYEQTLHIITPSLKNLKEVTLGELLKQITDVFESLRIAEKNQLFGMFDPEKGVINPYEVEEKSPFSFSLSGSRNTPIRPELFYAAMNFPIFAKNKFGFDSFYLIANLLKRYSDNAAGIKKLFSLYDNITLYKKLILELHESRDAKILEYKQALEKWNLDYEEWKNNPENEDKPFETPIPEAPLPITRDVILAAIQEYANNSTEGKKLPESIKEVRKSLEELTDMFIKLHLFIEKNEPSDATQPLPEEVRQAKLLYETLLQYGETLDPILTPELASQEIEKRKKALNSVQATIGSLTQYAIATTQGDQFANDILKALEEKGGYLNDFHREHISRFLTDLQKLLNDLTSIPSTVDNIVSKVNGEPTEINMFTVLNSIGFLGNGEESTNQIINLSREFADFELLEEKRVEGLIKAQKASIALSSYNSDGVLMVADALCKALTGSEKGVSSVLEAIDRETTLKTEKFKGFGIDRYTNTSEFILSDEFVSLIDLAILILLMVRSGFAGSTEEVESAFNHVGYAATIEKIKKEHNIKDGPTLTTLGLDIVNEGILNIQNSIYKLMYWKEVAANAAMLRTKIIDNADLGFRLNLMDQTYKKILKTEALDGWNGIADFRAAISSLSIFNELRTLNPEERLQNSSENQQELVKEELIKFELALYKFLAIDNAEILKNPVKLSEFINEDNFALGSTIDPIRNDDSLTDDNGIIWYLATVASIDPDVFYSNLKDSLLENRLPVALLTLYKLNVAAFYNNVDMFNNFRLALIESKKKRIDPVTKELVYKDLFSDNADLRKKAEQQFASEVLALTQNVKLTNTLLLSSGPGFGKSTYIPELILLLSKIFTDFNKETDLWLSGPDVPDSENRTEMADKMREAIGAEKTPTFNRDTLMKYILKDFSTYENNFKVTDGKLSTDVKLSLNLDGSIQFPFELNDNIENIPKVIIIDEISEFSTFDIKVLDEFARKHNIKIFAHGDFTQSGIYGEVKVNEFGEEATHFLGLHDVEFMRGFKSLLTFRSTNTQTDRNNALLRTYIDNLLKYYEDPNNNPAPPMLKLTHYRDISGNLYGTYVQNSSETGGEITELTDKTKEYIDGMYKSLQDGELVVLLFGDNNSLVYNYIKNNPEYLKKTLLRKGSVIKSTENRYYIIDLNTASFNLVNLSQNSILDIIHYIREYYTALTRQKQGAIVIDYINGKIPEMNVAGELPDTNTTKIEMPAKLIQKRSADFALMLNKLFPETISVKLRKKTQTPTPNKKSTQTFELGVNDDHKVNLDNIELDGDQYSSDNFARFANHNSEQLQRSIPLTIKRKSGTILVKGTTNGRVPYEIPDEFIEFILNTFNVLRTGLTDDLTYSKYAEERRDCINGLRYIQNVLHSGDLKIPDLDNPTEKTAKKVIEYLTKIHSLVRTKDNADIKKELYELLQLEDVLEEKDFDIRYGVISYPERWTTINGSRMDTNPWIFVDRDNEHCWGGKGQGDRNNEINRKELVLIIGKNNGQNSDDVYMTVPILSLPNYKTVYNKGKTSLPEVVTKTLDKIFDEVEPGHKQNIKVAQALRDILQADPNTTGAAALLKILEYYCNTENSIYFLDSNVQLAQTERNKEGFFRHLGWFVSALDRGFDYDAEGFELTSREAERLILHDVSELLKDGDKDVSNIFTAVSLEGYKNSRESKVPGFTLLSGATYVLVADKGLFTDIHGDFVEAAMFEHFLKLLSDPENTPILVTPIAVRPPEATFDEFIASEHASLFAKEGTAERRQNIGNLFTIYRVLQKLVAANIGTNTVKSVSDCIIALRGETRLNYDKIEKLILELTYLEGFISPERKLILREIYKLAESKLSDADKKALEKYAENYKNNYISAIDTKMTTQIKSNGATMILRTSFRRFLQTLYDPETMVKEEFLTWSSYDKAKFLQFVKDAVSEQALLYNPLFDGEKTERKRGTTYSITITLDNGNTDTVEFRPTHTDDDGINKYKYKGKEFKYASTVYSGPFVGNIMKIIDRVITSKGNTGGFRPNAQRINVFEKRARNNFIFANDALEHSFNLTNVDFDSVAKLNEKLEGYGMLALNVGKDILIMAKNSFPEYENVNHSLFKNFNKIDQITDATAFENDTVIFEVKLKNGALKFYKLERNNNRFKLIDITKVLAEDPWTKVYPKKERAQFGSTSCTWETDESAGLALITFDLPIDLKGGTKRILFNDITKEIELELVNDNRIKVEANDPDIQAFSDQVVNSMYSIIYEDANFKRLKSKEGDYILVPVKNKVTINGIEKTVNLISIIDNKITVDLNGTILTDKVALDFVQNYYPEGREYYKDIIADSGNTKRQYKPTGEFLEMLKNATGGTIHEEDSFTIEEMVDQVARATGNSKPLIIEIFKDLGKNMGNEFMNELESIDLSCL